MNRRPRPNPKYADVKPSIDTGYNLRKKLERLDELRHFYRFRPDEIFRRVNITALLTLMLEQAKLEIQEADLSLAGECLSSSADSAIDNEDFEEEEEEEDQFGRASVATNTENVALWQSPGIVSRGRANWSGIMSNRSSSVADLVQGFGGSHHDDGGILSAAASGVERRKEDEQSDLRPYLLLDVRTEDEYLKGHIKTAQSYPQSRLIRSLDFETHSMLRFKNFPGKILVVYDYDESVASRCATTLVQRGYDNVFMLSGGIRVANIKFPRGLLTTGETRSEGEVSEDDILLLEERLDEVLSSSTRLLSLSNSSNNSRLSRQSSRIMSRSQPALNRGWTTESLLR